MQALNNLIDWIWANPIFGDSSYTKRAKEDDRPHFEAVVLATYLLNFIVSCRIFSPLDYTPPWHDIAHAEEFYDPVWLMQLFSFVDFDVKRVMFYMLYPLTAGAALLFHKSSRTARVAALLGILLFGAFVGSFGKIDHNLHLLTIALATFAFFPVGGKYSVAKTAVTIAGLQLFTLATYTSSGFFKLLGTIKQLLFEDVSVFTDYSLFYSAIRSSGNSGAPSFLEEFLAANPSPMWGILLLGGYMVEFCALLVAFRPQYHKVYGMLILLLHLGIVLTVGPDFVLQMWVVGILFIMSPFSTVNKSNPSPSVAA